MVFLDEFQSVLLRGNEAIHLISLLDGTRNLVDVAYEAQQQVDPKVTYALINRFVDKGIVEVKHEREELRVPRAGVTTIE